MKKINKIFVILLILFSFVLNFTSCSTINKVKDTVEKSSSSEYTEDEKIAMESTAGEFMNLYGNKSFETLTLEIPMTKAMSDFFLSKSTETIHKKIINGEFVKVIESNFLIKNNAPCVHIIVEGSKGNTEYDLFFLESGEIQGFFLSNPTLYYKNLNSFVTLFVAFIIIILFYFMPTLSRKELFFGVRIPSEKVGDKELSSIYSLYKKLFIILVAPITLLLIVVSYFNILYINMNITLIAVIIMIFGVYLICHKKTKKIKTQNQWNINKNQFVYVDTEYVSSKRKKVTISGFWYLIPLLIIGISSLLILINYKSLPDSIPIHWGFLGEANGWIVKTPTSVMTVTIYQLVMTLLVFFGHMITRWSKQQINTSDPETSMRKDKIFRRRISIFLLVIVIYSTFTTSLFNLVSLNIFNLNSSLTAVISISFFVVIICSGIYITFFTGQGGSRLSLKDKNSNSSQSRNDDKFWKLGIFYVNKNDPSIFIEKRFGIGYTLNIGNLWGMTIMIIILLLIFVPLLMAWV
ncbi:DUF1648 domain-containing protein [Oceanirhabdus seepicola]|uniref:DUF1648 domain-containing protein n=1 Tax=Oceanirhabdus seepicola TaxID=2828781 RepID=A0A9J6P4A7_9CLOT|nr:DUF5808 domain-containing protein [Oceanirhabdus seepicola]MCM1990982.1 DUF1648 domain-containing protein [Oceanirhabdus seepicola]